MAGNTYDVVVLSSSPPAASPLHAPPARRVAMHPSSPIAFSPPASPLMKTPGASKTNLRAAPIPEGAVRGFATVGRLIRSEHFTSRLDDEFAEIQSAQERRGSLDITGEDLVRAKPTKKRTTKKTITADGIEKPKPKPGARKQQFKSATQIEDSDEELRLPPRPPTKSPFFDDKPAERSIADATTNTDANAPKLTKSCKPRKPRAKKQKVEEDRVEAAPKPKKARLTKSKAVKKDGETQQDDADLVSAHFRKNSDTGVGKSATHAQATRKSVEAQDSTIGESSTWDIPQSPHPKKKSAPKLSPPDPIAKGLDLDEAVLRRRDWTPPPADTTIQTPFTDSIGKENKGPVRNGDGTFTNLLSDFAYAQSLSVAKAASVTTTEVMAATKRRRVELVEIPSNQTNSRDTSLEKGKAPKKKPRTITDLVTGQYAPKEAEPKAVRSDFLSPRTTTTVTKVPLNGTPDAAPKKAPRKRNTSKAGSEKAPSKPRAKKVTAKPKAKSKPVAEKLLSPASALMRMNRQDILFGTSSQLALEESPTMVRQLQYAIRESEQDANSLHPFSITPPPRFKMQGKRGLWAVSARDDEGGMLEQVEDVRMPEPDRTQDFPLLMLDGAGDERDEPPFPTKTRSEEPDDFIDIDDIEPDPPAAITISSDLPTPPRLPVRAPKTQPSELGSPMKGVEFTDIDEFSQPPPSNQKEPVFEDIDNYQEPPPSNQNADSQNSNSFIDIDDFDFPLSAQMRTSPALKFKVPTPALASTGSLKKRGRPTKSQSAVPTTTGSLAPVLKPPPSKSKLKSKPKETDRKPLTPPLGSGRFIDIEEILDSEDEAFEALSPTPPRVRNLPNLAPLPLISLFPTSAKSKPINKTTIPIDPTIVRVHRIEKRMLEWPNIKPTIFAKISAHIRALKPTTDPTKPTWHEKILMYTPIMLEDFTLYLNATPFPSIRVYRKATLKQVKAWNSELKSMGEPVMEVRGEEEMVLAVEKELDASMVQSWCESLSICCVYGEGRGKGGARKGLY